MTITPRERALMAIALEEPDRVPIGLGVSNATGINMGPCRVLKELLGILASGNAAALYGPHRGVMQVGPDRRAARTRLSQPPWSASSVGASSVGASGRRPSVSP